MPPAPHQPDQTPWHKKTWIIVLALLLLPPLGVLLVWLKTSWSRKQKWIATGVGLVALILGLSANGDNGAVPAGPVANAPAPTATVTAAPSDTPTKTSDAKPSETAKATPSKAPASPCRRLPASRLATLNHRTSLHVRHAYYVPSDDYDGIYIVAADLQGPGVEGDNDVAVWATGNVQSNPPVDAPGKGFLSVEATAKAFSDWTDGSSLGFEWDISGEDVHTASGCVDQ